MRELLQWGSGGINISREEGLLLHQVKANQKEKKNTLVAFQNIILQGIKWVIMIPDIFIPDTPYQLDQTIIGHILLCPGRSTIPYLLQ